MGLFSKKSSPASVKATSPKEVIDAILKLNRPTAPYQIVRGKKEGVDLIAEWKIVDAKWYVIFAKAGLKKVFKIYMKLDTEKHHQMGRRDTLRVAFCHRLSRTEEFR